MQPNSAPAALEASPPKDARREYHRQCRALQQARPLSPLPVRGCVTRARSCLPRRPRLQAALLLIIYTTFCDAFGSDALTEQSPISVAAVAARKANVYFNRLDRVEIRVALARCGLSPV